MDEERLSFNGGKDKESVSTGGGERVRRCCDSFIHAPDCGEAGEGRQRDGVRTCSGVEERNVCVWLGV